MRGQGKLLVLALQKVSPGRANPEGSVPRSEAPEQSSSNATWTKDPGMTISSGKHREAQTIGAIEQPISEDAAREQQANYSYPENEGR